jgi:hypothetical protein
VKALLEFSERHPLLTTATTIASGMLAWILDHTQQITAVAGMIGAVSAALVAFAGFIVKLWQASQSIVTAIRRVARRREQRRLHASDAPLEPRPLPKVRVEDNGDETFTILERVEWLDVATGALIRAEPGDRTDFASIPRLIWPIIPPYGRHSLAAVIHDKLYQLRGALPGGILLSWWQCNRIFRDIMRASGVRWSRRWVMWLGVTLGGWVPWIFGPHDDDSQPPGLAPLVALCGALLCLGCSSLAGYDRSYQLSYTDPAGRQISGGITLHPRGLAK